MNNNSILTKRELVSLLDRDHEIDRQIFENFNGELFANSTEFLRIDNLRQTFELLIPKTVWAKEDFLINYKELSFDGITEEDEGKTQLLLSVSGQAESYVCTSDAVQQLFEPVKMSTYAKYLLDGGIEHFNLLLENSKYWFEGDLADEKVLVRTVTENGQYIIRCFASQSYRPIDNHILLYITAWALDRMPESFTLVNPKVSHSTMLLDILADEKIEIPGVGELSYGLKLRNSENKQSSVEYHPFCELSNIDGTSATMIVGRILSIVHRGNSTDTIMARLVDMGDFLKNNIDQAVENIKTVHGSKVDGLLAFKIQNKIIDIIGKNEFKKYADKYREISSTNTYNLLEFFGRLHDIPVKDDDKKMEIQRLYWGIMEELIKDLK